MKCINKDCTNKRNIKAKYVTFDYSEKIGIPDCKLEDVKEFECPKCKTVFHDIGDSDDIDKQIATILCGIESLTRQHVKWLRSNFFQMTYFEFGDLIDESPTYLRELEQFKRPMTRAISAKIQLEIENKLIRKSVTFKVN